MSCFPFPMQYASRFFQSVLSKDENTASHRKHHSKFKILTNMLCLCQRLLDLYGFTILRTSWAIELYVLHTFHPSICFEIQWNRTLMASSIHALTMSSSHRQLRLRPKTALDANTKQLKNKNTTESMCDHLESTFSQPAGQGEVKNEAHGKSTAFSLRCSHLRIEIDPACFGGRESNPIRIRALTKSRSYPLKQDSLRGVK